MSGRRFVVPPDILGCVMTWNELIQQWWLQLAAGLAVVAITAGVAAIFSKKVRDRFWRPALRVLAWPLTQIRLTTRQRQEALIDQLAAARSDAVSISAVGDETIVHLQNELEKAQNLSSARTAEAELARRNEVEAIRALAQKQIADERRINESQVELARITGHDEGRAAALVEIEAQRAVLKVKPVWRIVENDSGERPFWIRNVQRDAEAHDVCIDAPMGDFVFHTETQWPGVFPNDRQRPFAGERIGNGRKFGVTFSIRYRDANGDWQAGQATIEREPRRAVIL